VARIVYFYQYFSTPKGAWGTRVYEFARQWVAQGHQVTVVSSVYSKSDLQPQGLVSTQWFDGIEVKVLNVRIDNRQPVWKRILSFIKYSLLSSWYALRLPAHVVVASSGPITAGLPGLVARYLRGRKMVFEVRDLWPEGAIAMGMLQNKWLQKAAYAFENRCYKAANQIVCLSPGMAQNITQRLGHTHVHAVPNASDMALFGAPPQPRTVLPAWAQNKQLAVYTGNIGPVNNSMLLLKAAALLHQQQQHHIMLVLIGQGQQQQAIEQAIEQQALPNIKVLPLMPKTQVVHWVQHAMCALVPLSNRPVLNTSSPNKLFDALAAGTPVIQTTQGWLKTLLDTHQCGATVSAQTPEPLVATLLEWAANKTVRTQMGQAAKTLAQQQFTKEKLGHDMLTVLLKAQAGN